MVDLHGLRQACVLLQKQGYLTLTSHKDAVTLGFSPNEATPEQTCLVLAAAARLLLLALGLVGRLVAGRARARQVGVRGQVAAGDERAHVDVVGEDVVADELAEEQHQVGEFHPLALVPGLGCRGRG